MKKRSIILTVMLLLASLLSAAALDVQAEGLPTSVHLTWNGIEGSEHYDIYNGDVPVARLDRDAREYTVTHLLSDTEYRLCIAARSPEDKDLAAEWVSESTTSWDGVYEWINETDDDNNGKLRHLKLRLETNVDPDYGQYQSVFLMFDDGSEFMIFPLFPFDSELSGTWIDYDDESRGGVAYRTNSELYNVSPFKPSRWRIDRIEIDYDSTSAYIQTSALGITVMTETSYHLYMEDGSAMMAFETKGTGIADKVIFKNPNPGEGDAFILRRIQ